ncbi:2-amino-4-hydroxy-6-hydroxymethyldihydropteridine diphosphokinase [Bathymodiolus japonicus methanotrophic gill symbiont]|uniref:2-amino-4-hydroxy-6- hydroxymethyldihydropteridine diphosphokinase n=1 Tax=Bathymodiolus japonicus methanotrophic gill symbiont TaxID=113269 RepID=UPI001B66B002|nr:2-amino-4-hydroxy-6-hydroxymethyldihydropteridine diphosphokinase [Bathymodiolus japonicus methanotrophic gill symbiont]GFO72969.1 2-amino-4-hydroxy-6-hydroxymethyldihydropteridine diphosphokinase [Bathymodiolus japonicus methanotrophic gill symbiont]
MTKEIVYIGLGSNLATPAAQIHTARQVISKLDSVLEQGFSSLYCSPPMGPQDQPDYVNAVMAIATDLPAIDLLRCLQQIEMDHGRVRKDERWSARALDLDILLYGQHIIDQADLIVPHYGLAKRAFVLYPLHEITPMLNIPGVGDITKLLESCPLDGLVRMTS